jgi:hypothetical protein
VGPFDYFRRRRERESATAGLELAPDEPTAAAPPAVGAGSGDAAPSEEAVEALESAGIDLAQLGQIGQMILEAAREGNIQVHIGEPQALDLSDVELPAEVVELAERDGIDLSSLLGPDAERRTGG